MPDFDCVIRGGVVLIDRGLQSIDIGVIAGRIAALRAGLGAGVRTIDAAGRIVLPGGVDSHAHIEQGVPGRFVNVDTFETGTASAAVGGTTTVICFARQNKGESLRAAVGRAVRART
jgi:dihydropyrimidinase